ERRRRGLRRRVRVGGRRGPRAAAGLDRGHRGARRVRDRRVRRGDRRIARRAGAGDRPAAADVAVPARGGLMTPARVVVASRRRGGWGWRLPLVALLWLAIAAPILATGAVAMTLRRWAKDLPDVPDLAAWRAQAPQTSLIVAADGSHLAELPFRD